jgi:hypothetical protein
VSAFSAAVAYCRTVGTLQAELNLSGQVGQQRLRGRVLAGFAPGALRLEGVAPFGSPAFILAADGPRGTLLLPRDRRVLQDTPPEDILNALIGVPLGPDDLRAALSGCLRATANPTSGRAYGADWISVDVGTTEPSAPAATLYLNRVQGQPPGWRIVAGRYAGLEIEYPQFAGAQPSQIVIRSGQAVGGVTRSTVALTIRVSQVEVNGELPRDQLVAVTIPPAFQPITLTELRQSGPVGR